VNTVSNVKTFFGEDAFRAAPPYPSGLPGDWGVIAIIANHERVMAKWYYIRLMSIRPHTAGARFR